MNRRRKAKFQFLTGDTNFTDYGGTWWAKSGPETYFVITLTNWENATGEQPDGDKYLIDLAEVDLSDDEQIGRAMGVYGWDSDLLDEYGNRRSDGELVDAMRSAGSYAPLGDWSGSNWRKLMASAKTEANELLSDPVRYEDAMDRPVNKIGSTAREYAQGDIQSAILRGVDRGDPEAELMSKMMGMARKGNPRRPMNCDRNPGGSRKERFVAAMAGVLADHGATIQERPGLPSRQYHVIETVAGPLWISIFDDWVAMRFDDVEAARELFGVREYDFNNLAGLNTSSGKWNFHPSSPPRGKQPFNEWLFSVTESFNRMLGRLQPRSNRS